MNKAFLKLGNQFGVDPNINPDPVEEARPFFILQNGVTVRLKGGLPAGTTGKADGDDSGKTYTAVDQTMWNALDPATDDYTTICTTLVTDMIGVFENSTFNQDISHFDTSNITRIDRLFRNNSDFNQNISFWDMSNCENFSNAFNNTDSFNQPIGVWNMSSATNLSGMFNNNAIFNQPLNNWDVSSVINMDSMFRNCIFNQDISDWDVANVTNMTGMFLLNTQFNQDLTGWCVTNIPTEPTDFAGATFLPANRPIWGSCP
jgi:surface protein